MTHSYHSEARDEADDRAWRIEVRRWNFDDRCIDCDGDGKQNRLIQHKDRLNEWITEPCETCNGTGEVDYRDPPIEYVVKLDDAVVAGPFTSRQEAFKRAGPGLKVVARLVEQREGEKTQ